MLIMIILARMTPLAHAADVLEPPPPPATSSLAAVDLSPPKSTIWRDGIGSGFLSSALSSLFTGPAGFWNFGGSLTQPIFAGGRIRSGVKLSEARKEEMLLTYERTIQQAFRGVSDSLVEYRKDREFRERQQELLLAAQDAARLSEMRYRGGATSYLEVLTNETNSFNAELGLAEAQLNELLGLVDIYRNLGGGWQS